MYKILVVDDDIQMIGLLSQLLEREGYAVLTASSAEEALVFVGYTAPDLFIIDVSLPDVNGLELCRVLRGMPRTAELPILFITGQETGATVTDALNVGGDDFIRKPFAVRELTARLRALLRRVVKQEEMRDDMPSIQIYPGMRMVLVDERAVDLTQVEFDLLLHLCAAPNKLHSTRDLLMQVWKYPANAGDAALVRNHIRNLRRKLEMNPDHPAIIQSRHGRGYTVKAYIRIRDGEPTQMTTR